MSSDPRDPYTRTVEPEVITDPINRNAGGNMGGNTNGSPRGKAAFQDFLNRLKDPSKRKPVPILFMIIALPLVLGLFIVLFFIGLGALILAKIIITIRKLLGIQGKRK